MSPILSFPKQFLAMEQPAAKISAFVISASLPQFNSTFPTLTVPQPKSSTLFGPPEREGTLTVFPEDYIAR